VPRRTVSRCPTRATGADGPRITLPIEENLTAGSCWGFADFRTLAEYQTTWHLFGAEITRRWITAFPGSRPLAAYIVGEITPPDWVHPDPVLRHPLHEITGLTVAIDTAFHRNQFEFDHLLDLGLIGDAERQLAEERLDSPGATHFARYRPLHREG